MIGFGVLALSGLALGIGVHLLQPSAPNYFFLLPGLLLFGTGLAFVLTACDPVSLDSVNPDLAGQVSGVSATAEQGGGAVGIAGLYAIFHQVYVRRLEHLTHSGTPNGLTPHQGEQLRQALQAAEQTGSATSPFRSVVDPIPRSGFRSLKAWICRRVLLSDCRVGGGEHGGMAAGSETERPSTATGCHRVVSRTCRNTAGATVDLSVSVIGRSVVPSE